MGASPWSSLLPFSSYAPPDLVSLSLLLAIVLLSCCYYFYLVNRSGYNYGDRQLPPGSLGLPLGLGENLHYLLGMNCPMGSPRPFLSYRLHKYGTVFKTHLLGCPIVISMDATLNKLLLSNEGKLVQAAYPYFVEKVLGPFVNLHDKRHQQMRELARTMLSPTAVQALHFIPLQEYTRDFLKSWSDMVVIDAKDESKKFVFLYILKFLLRLPPEDPRTTMLMDDYKLISKGHCTMPVAFPGTTYNKALKARQRIMTTIGKLVHEQRNNNTKEDHEDFIDVIMKETKKYDGFPEQDIHELANGFVTGSIDTTSALLTSVLKFLSENPHVTRALTEEHTLMRQNKKENELLTWDDYKEMQFTKSVIKETLRVTSIVEFVARKALQDIVFKDMIIPKGWRILVNFSMLHLSPTLYENPLKFDPWRWQDVKTDGQTFFMPFSGGIRTCLGSLFAEVEVSIFLHYFLTNYKSQALLDSREPRDIVSGHFTPRMTNKKQIKVVRL